MILGESLAPLAAARRIARRSRRLLAQNVAWALAYNVLAVPLAAFGLVPPWAAALGMSVSSLAVVANAMRLARPADGESSQRKAVKAVPEVFGQARNSRQADEAEKDHGEPGGQAHAPRARETPETFGGEPGREEIGQGACAERGHHRRASQRAARYERRREHAVDEPAGDPAPGEPNGHCPRARVRGREARSQTREGSPRDAAGPLQDEHRGSQTSQRETQENYEGIGHDQEKDPDWKKVAVEEPQTAQASGERPGAAIARDSTETVGELPANARLRRAQIERRDDAAAHRDAVNSSRQSDDKRGREESGQCCDNNSRRVHRSAGVLFFARGG